MAAPGRKINTIAALRISSQEGIWATIHATLTTGAFLTGYALWLGANDFQLAVLTSIPLLLQLFQIPGAYLVERTGRRKHINSLFAFLGRLLWLPMALLPLASFLAPIPAFLVLYTLSSMAMSLAGPAWVVWMSDLVPERVRGRYFGTRNKILAITVVIASLAAGVVIDFFRGRQLEYQGYLFLFLVAVITAVFSFRLIRRQPDPGYQAEPMPPLSEYLVRPFRDAGYRRLMIFFLYWIFAVGLASPFFSAHLIRNLQWSFKEIAVAGVLSAIGSIVAHPAWGRAIDRHGHKPVLMVTALAILHLPLYYLLCPYTVRWPIYAHALLTGLVWSGFNLAIFNLVMSALPDTGRPGYVALYSGLSGLFNFISSTLGGVIAEYFSGAEWRLGALTVGNYQVIFLLTVLLRVPGVFLLRGVPDPGAKRTVVLVRHFFQEIDRRLGLGRQYVTLSGRRGR